MSEKIKVIDPHSIKSNEVEPHNLKRVFKDAEAMVELMGTKIGFYNKHLACSHPQITDQYPLRFFVVNPNVKEGPFAGWKEIVIINPVILRHTKTTIDSKEGCMTFSKMPMRTVPRWNKCEVEFNTLVFPDYKEGQEGEPEPKMSERKRMNLNGLKAKIFQHEIDHLNAKYIYPLNLKQL